VIIKFIEFRSEFVKRRVNYKGIKSNEMGMNVVELDSIRSRSKNNVWIKLSAIRMIFNWSEWVVRVSIIGNWIELLRGIEIIN